MAYFTTSDARRIYFEDTGSGQPLLCLAGLTRNCRDFDFLAPHMRDLRLIAMDYRGRGRSDYDDDYMNYNVLREKRDAIELLDHLGLDRVTVLGTSRGGLIAMAMAATFSDRMAGVILNDIGPIVGAAGIAKIMDFVGKRPDFPDYDSAAAGFKAAFEPIFPGVPLARWRTQVAAQFVEAEDGLDLRYDPRLHKTLLDQAATGALADMWMFFEALKPLPVGVLRGANSDILGADTVAEMHRRHPGLISAEVPDRGHVPFLDEPESLDIIRRILKAAA